jgi:hypothetical protein
MTNDAQHLVTPGIKISSARGGDGQTRSRAEGDPGLEQGPQGQRVPEKNARTTARAIEARSPQPRAVATASPRISPMPQPVRQWVVALRPGD